MLGFSKRSQKKAAKASLEVFDQYEQGKPDHQNAIDALQGWNCAFPSELNLNAGKLPLYADDRIDWALRTFGSIEGRTVLEIGPLEGMHTFMLHGHRPARIDAIEANRLCFLRCLVTKQILNIDTASFMLGDIQAWLKEREETYDFALASGVLYHMADPGEFLRLLAKRSNAVFIWTHFVLEDAMPEGDVRWLPFTGKVETRMIDGIPVRYYERSYHHANANASFCGGMKDRHFWMHRDDILMLLREVGFNEITIRDEDLSHPGGPSFSLLARKVPVNT
ncbi:MULTISPECIES: class I SAM-dependent methyltransferase [unclassified Rhizobium]|uniref:class I SAM-dependent methyltransferase n=1 Tax=unclassified Rhizobium TaxID=2613769 RepID=UPI000EA9122D|nr:MULTISPECIES: class I SAM-dependent methyltransferase [unclassified Rhizobium]AYG65829.1 class I SAM-dependent methyltransferase [Rhizobium sp. CCGE531]AYG72310.1 class I SAM-dependent methyltransferase [Rhizobium sp. CCGE532]